MNGSIIKIGLGAALLWYGILRGAKALAVNVHSYTFRSLDIANDTVSFDLNISIKNPLLVGITVSGIEGDIYVQGVKAGYVNMQFNYYISGGRTHILPIVVNLKLSSLSQAAIQNIQSGDLQTLTVSFNGKLYVGSYGVAIPIQLDYNYNDLVK